MQQSTLKPRTVDRTLAARYNEIREATLRLSAPLAPEDCVVQSMPDVSPTKWHLGHVSWFFESFLLKPYLAGYRPAYPEYEQLFNSYYNSLGQPFPRPQRGLLSRPTVADVRLYRAHVDEQMGRLLQLELPPEASARVEIGLQHEQQHQELLLMDIKHVFSCNPLYPVYREPKAAPTESGAVAPLHWVSYPEEVAAIGHAGAGFSFDNERPRHRLLVHEFELASRLVTNGEYLQFMEDVGYGDARHWLADGWSMAQTEGWQAPLYWVRREDTWLLFSLAGLRPLDPAEPVAHVSYYEAQAYAAWAHARLPTEAEWEVVASQQPLTGTFLEDGWLHPQSAEPGNGQARPSQLFGDVWEWTQSPYLPYPGFLPEAGALGEYNGKFMCNQYVLRGGACVTPRSHIRATYRNFFYPHCRWQFSGIRLARQA